MPYTPEGHLIASIVRNGDMATALKHGVTAEMFHVYPDEWAWLETYFSKYRKSPSRIAFMVSHPKFRMLKTDDTPHFSDEVRKAHAKFMMTEVLNDVADYLTDGDVEGAVKKMQASLISIAAGVSNLNDGDILTDFDDIVFDAEARRQRVLTRGSSGIPSGITCVDKETGGFNPGELIIIAARLGHGKSWLMQLSAAKAAAAGYSVQYDALEQTRSQVTYRIHALLSGTYGQELFRSRSLMQGKDYNPKAYRQFLVDLKHHIKGRIHVSDTTRGRVSALTVQSQLERNKPDVVFIDYLGLMQRSNGDWQGMAELSGQLKQLASEYAVPIVAAAQLNREYGLGKEPPGAEAIAQSDAIGQDADMVITGRRRSPTVFRGRLAKNRNGIDDFMWDMEFRPNDGIIREVSADRAADLIDEDEDRKERALKGSKRR